MLSIKDRVLSSSSLRRIVEDLTFPPAQLHSHIVAGREGFVKQSDLGGAPLLELYFIDVGQGDGVLIVTPEHKHLLIDGGWPRRGQHRRSSCCARRHTWRSRPACACSTWTIP